MIKRYWWDGDRPMFPEPDPNETDSLCLSKDVVKLESLITQIKGRVRVTAANNGWGCDRCRLDANTILELIEAHDPTI